MRIVAGQWRGRRIQAPAGRETRPTSDRVREAIASAVIARLGSLEHVRVLDLFAGSGALGLEALSRGAAHVTFIDAEPRATAAIRENLARLNADPDRYTVRTLDIDARNIGSQVAGGISLLFADPPYRIEGADIAQLLERLGRSGALVAGALIVYEHASDVAAQWPDGFEEGPRRTYGDTAVSFATYEGGQ